MNDTSSLVVEAFKVAASMCRDVSFINWSSTREIKGDMTSVKPVQKNLIVKLQTFKNHQLKFTTVYKYV